MRNRQTLTKRILICGVAMAALDWFSGCVGGSSGTVGPTAPAITSQPTSQTVPAGQMATFSVAATGTAPLAYQWSKNGTAISGATSSSYTTPATTAADNGSQFQVTVSNAAGSIPSAKVTLTVTSGGGSGSVNLVQHVSGSNTRNNNFSSPFCYHFQLPNPTIQGNAVVVGFTFNSNPTPFVSDDKGDGYTVQINHFDSADTQSIGIATAFNVAAGARVISVCFTADPGGFVQPMATEFDNVVGMDGNAVVATQGSGTSVSPGTLTPSVTGDLAYQVVCSLSTSQTSFTAGSQSNITWNLLSADLMDGWAAQSGQYGSTVAFAPTLTMGSSQKWISAGVLLKTGNTGGVPSGMHIVHLVHENIPEHTGSGGTGNPFPNPSQLQFPSSGNVLVAMMGGGNNSCVITSMSDSKNNSWVQAGAAQVINGNDTVQAFYAGSANSSSDLALTLNWSATDGDFTIFLYDVAGAAASPLDTTVGAVNNQNIAGNLTVFSITPAGANELIFAETIWDYNTGSGMLPAGSFFDTNTFDGESQSGPEPVDENNAWGHVVSTSAAPITITWQVMFGGLPVQNWAGMAVAFKPGP
jgi:hypothetical protein